MEDSLRTGFMAAFAVSGGVVFIAMQAHNRLLSDFFNKMEFQIKNSTGALKDIPKKKVRFADVAAESTAEKAYTEEDPAAVARRSNYESLEGMPLNRQALYKGILQRRNLRGYN